MTEFNIFRVIIVFSLFLFKASSQFQHENKPESSLDTAGIIESRGFRAESHHVSPSPGYNLSLIRLINPAIPPNTYDINPIGSIRSLAKRRQPSQPILFIHGIFESGKSFLLNSHQVRPKNYAFVNVRLLKESGLRNLLRQDPSSNSLPFLLSNFGFDVWMLSRRATLESQSISELQPIKRFNLVRELQATVRRLAQTITGQFNQFNSIGAGDNERQPSNDGNHLNNLRSQFANNNKNDSANVDDLVNRIVYANNDQPTVNSPTTSYGYWNFSLDEQARYDIPKVIDYILAKTNKLSLSIVGHSLGAALPLMTLCERPEYGHKISRQILFAPALNLGESYAKIPIVQLVAMLEPILIAYKGPILPNFVMPLLQTLIVGPCKLGLLNDEALCLSIMDALFGFSSKQLNKLTGEIVNKLMDSSGSNEIVQLMQSMRKGKMHHFEQMNGFSQGSVYNVSAIKAKTRFSIWSGNKDFLVTQGDTQSLIEQLHQVEVEKNFIDWPGIHFNHVAFLLHQNVSTLVNIPTLLTLSSP